MWLGTALVTHPAYVHTPDDAWLWARLLEQGAEGLEVEPLAALSWSCVAAAAELASKCRRPCLTTPPVCPAWCLLGLRPLLPTPGRSLSIMEACRGPSSPPPAAPQSQS